MDISQEFDITLVFKNEEGIKENISDIYSIVPAKDLQKVNINQFGFLLNVKFRRTYLQ